MSYKFIDHTADVKFQAFGNSLEGAFTQAFYALRETISGDIVVLTPIKKEIKITGTDLNNLLYKFLEESLFLLDSEDFLSAKIEDIKIDKEKLEVNAVISGDKAKNYSFTNDVKAITYNDMIIEFDEKSKSWLIQVVLDV